MEYLKIPPYCGVIEGAAVVVEGALVVVTGAAVVVAGAAVVVVAAGVVVASFPPHPAIRNAQINKAVINTNNVFTVSLLLFYLYQYPCYEAIS